MKFLFSSIGQKIQIAVSGILLTFFLIFHLINNLVLFSGKTAFNNMVLFLESIKPLIRIMEFGLLCILIMHIANALYLVFLNKKAKGIQYKYNAQSDVSSLNSRTMAVSGSIVLLFFIVHLSYIWYTYQITSDHDYYNILLQNKLGFLGHTATALFYIIAIIFISFHLKHGFNSALKTFGIGQNTKLGILYNIGIFIWGVIPLGFIFIIIAIQLGIIS